MRVLIKFPSRSRPDKLLHALFLYTFKCSNRPDTAFLLTLDEDDTSMTPEILDEIRRLLEPFEHRIVVGKSENKIHAINRDMDQAPPHDILLLASDDMLPVVRGYDEIIRGHMREFYPDTDGVLWYNDGYAGDKLNTLVCMGRTYYNRFGFIYNPAYKSFFCDNEFMDIAAATGKQRYFPLCIIRHQHPANTGDAPDDDLYRRNQRYWKEDQRVYFHRKSYDYDLSVCICSLEDRRPLLETLLSSLRASQSQSSLRIELLVLTDNRELTIGEKRNKLAQQAKGKYCCFVDDDDGIAPDYFKEIEEVLRFFPAADCVSMTGMYYVDGIAHKPFYHSLRHKSYREDDIAYYRPPNHLNPILTGFVRHIGFTKKNHGEDTDFAMRLHNADLLWNEASVRKTLYHYYFRSKKEVGIGAST